MYSKSKIGFSLSVTILEWFEFALYNSVAKYLPKIISNSNEGIGWIIFGLAFLARPLGSIYFSRIADKKKSLLTSLFIMSLATLLLALTPTALALAPVWIFVCKIFQGFALGGSYGMNYLLIYDAEEQKQVPYLNFKIGIVQTGFVIGSVLGEFSVAITKIAFGISDQFLTVGWRLPFIASAGASAILFLRSSKMDLGIENTAKSSFFLELGRQPLNIFRVFVASSIEMVLYYFWYVYLPSARELDVMTVFSANAYSLGQKLLLIPLFPIFGLMIDSVNNRFKRNFNQIGLFCTAISFIICNLVVDKSGLLFFILSSCTTGLCYANLIPWVIAQFSREVRPLVIGTIFSLSGAIVGGWIPVIAEYTKHANQNLIMSALMIPALVVFCLPRKS